MPVTDGDGKFSSVRAESLCVGILESCFRVSQVSLSRVFKGSFCWSIPRWRFSLHLTIDWRRSLMLFCSFGGEGQLWMLLSTSRLGRDWGFISGCPLNCGCHWVVLLFHVSSLWVGEEILRRELKDGWLIVARDSGGSSCTLGSRLFLVELDLRLKVEIEWWESEPRLISSIESERLRLKLELSGSILRWRVDLGRRWGLERKRFK